MLVAVMVLGVLFVGSPDRHQQTDTAVASSRGLGGTSAAVDEYSAAQIAADIAKGVDLIVADNVQNLADSQKTKISFAVTEGSYLAKTQQVRTNDRTNRGVTTYTVKEGENVPEIAKKFNVTSDTIRWENDIIGDFVNTGTKLKILPVSGIRYKVREGDTIKSIAERYNANENLITAFNDTEITGLKSGANIIIPGAEKPQERPTYFSSGSGFAFGTTALYGGNGYSYGYCTYYVASRIDVPRNWGNAISWASNAAASGWNVTTAPRVGAIAQTPNAACYNANGHISCLGHVAIVEEVSDDGSKVKISDMNGVAGWNAVGYSDWMPASSFPNYIHR